MYNRVNNRRQKGTIIVLCCQGKLGVFSHDFGEKVGKIDFVGREKGTLGEKTKNFL